MVSAGLTAAEATDQGVGVVLASATFGDTSRALVEGGASGQVAALAGRRRGVLVEAWAMGPGADERISELSTAMRCEIPLGHLLDVMHCFPTLSEACDDLYRRLAAEMEQLGHPPRLEGRGFLLRIAALGRVPVSL